jgi:iron complex transport system permease protein
VTEGRGRSFAVNGALLAALAAIVTAGLLAGPAKLGLGDVVTVALGGGDKVLRAIVIELRLPRLLLGVLVGGTLGAAGAVLQAMFRNPLAEPGVIGVSSCAALGAVLVLYLGLAGYTDVVLPLAAMTVALLGMGLLLAVVLTQASMLTLILAGVILNSFAAALVALALNLSPNPFAYNDIMFWLMGSLANRSFTDIVLILPFLGAGWLLMAASLRPLRATVLSDQAAQSLGVNLRLARGLVIAGVALAVGASVAVSGVIGFVGLVAPHMVRPLVGHDPVRVFVPSALAGAILLTGADILIRLIPGGANLRLGVLTALLGAPFFLYYLLASRRTMP